MAKQRSCEHGPAHYRYFLTCEEYERLRQQSSGRCKRCTAEMTKICIDHDYAIGKGAVRGLLCARCNSIVSAVERFDRDGDDLTYAYLDGLPFHALIDPAELATRNARAHRLDVPRPRCDQHVVVVKEAARVGYREAADMIGRSVEELLILRASGRIIAMWKGEDLTFRRVVLERFMKEEARRAALTAATPMAVVPAGR